MSLVDKIKPKKDTKCTCNVGRDIWCKDHGDPDKKVSKPDVSWQSLYIARLDSYYGFNRPC